MSNAYFPGNVVEFRAVFRNKATNAPENPDTVVLYIYSHTDDERTTVAEGSLTNSSTGVWTYDYTIPIESDRDKICYGFYGTDSNGDPYAYSEKVIRVRRTCADPNT